MQVQFKPIIRNQNGIHKVPITKHIIKRNISYLQTI